MSIFWNAYNARRIAEANTRADQSVMSAEDARTRAMELEARVDKLMLINRALFELMSAHLNIGEQELIEKVTEIDLRDGKLDGKLAPEGPLVCEKCARAYSRRHNHCLYCGHINGVGTAF